MAGFQNDCVRRFDWKSSPQETQSIDFDWKMNSKTSAFRRSHVGGLSFDWLDVTLTDGSSSFFSMKNWTFTANICSDSNEQIDGERQK